MSEFRAERAGEYRKNLSGELTYFSYVPHPLPPYPAVELNEDGIRLLVETNKSLAVLESVSGRIPDMDLFASMYVRKEALMSSQIEGTQATLEDVLDPMINENMNRDVADVVNYIRATDYAIGRLKDLPLCNRLIRETHAVLMENVRGQEKDPGLRPLQKRLAKEVTCMVHSEEDYNAAVEASNILFGNATADALHRLDEETFLQVFDGVERYEIARAELEAGIPPLDLLAEKTNIFPSKGEARKMIQANGFSMNKEKLTDPQSPITAEALLNGKYIVFQKGKKSYYLVVAK